MTNCILNRDSSFHYVPFGMTAVRVSKRAEAAAATPPLLPPSPPKAHIVISSEARNLILKALSLMSSFSFRNSSYIRLILLLAIPALLPACSSMYIPAVRSIPFLEEKGEFQGEAGVSTNSVYVNGSYAFTKDVAISVNGNLSYRNFTNRYDVFTHKDASPPSGGGYLGPGPDTRGKFAHRYGEISFGRINMLTAFLWKLEMFGGAGMGRATDIDQFNNDNRYKSDYYSFFGQGNFGIKHRVVEAGVSLRFAYSKFDYTANLYAHGLYEESLYHTKFDVFHAEPMVFGRFGKGNLKAVLRIGVNLAWTINPNEEDTKLRGLNSSGELKHTVIHYSVGASYRIKGKKIDK
ncbi:MAG: hypothetical protein FWG84_10245 [Bacteroidales bacterium]|nr:hypothetical protein [Bacteroidales bacterium]